MNNNEHEITDDTRIVRFLDLNGAIKSIGELGHPVGIINFNFHFGLLSDYAKCEGSTADKYERIMLISHNNQLSHHNTCNDSLVSCWSIWEKGDNPWDDFSESAFSTDESTICVIVSTIGKIKNLFNNIIEINRKRFHNFNTDMIIKSKSDRVTYYNPKDVTTESWDQKITNKANIFETQEQIIFHKLENDGKGKKFIAECEYRLAMILAPDRTSPDSDPGSDLYIKNSDLLIHDYPLTTTFEKYYLDKIFLDLDAIRNNKTKKENEISRFTQIANVIGYNARIPVMNRNGEQINYLKEKIYESNVDGEINV